MNPAAARNTSTIAGGHTIESPSEATRMPATGVAYRTRTEELSAIQWAAPSQRPTLH
jgi:hypothetical protein